MEKWTVDRPNILSSWREIAITAITQWLGDEEYRNMICRTTMKGEDMGPFTKFLYAFACKCECGWGVMIDFNERTQKVFLTGRYYKWMHKLRDEITEENN